MVALSLAVTLALACTRTTVTMRAAETPPGPPPGYQETFVAPQTMTPDAGYVMVAPPNNYWQEAFVQEDPSYFLTGFGGASYFDSEPDTSLGGQYGLNLAIPIYGAFGAAVGGGANHYEGGTQYGASAGLYMGAAPREFGWTVFFDQFSDTSLDNPYILQGRYGLMYAINEELSVGARYTDPIHADDVDNNLIVPAAIGTTPLTPAEVVEGHLTYGRSAMNYVEFGVGYIDEIETMTYRTSFAEPISDRWSAKFDASYDEDIGRWSGFFGFAVDISPIPMPERHIAARVESDDVVRGEVSALLPLSSTLGGSGSAMMGSAMLGSGMMGSTREQSLFAGIAAMQYLPFTPLLLQDSIGRAAFRVLTQSHHTHTGCNCPHGLVPSSSPGFCEDPYHHHHSVPCL